MRRPASAIAATFDMPRNDADAFELLEQYIDTAEGDDMDADDDEDCFTK